MPKKKWKMPKWMLPYAEHISTRNAFAEAASKQMSVAWMEKAEKKAARETFDLWEELR